MLQITLCLTSCGNLTCGPRPPSHLQDCPLPRVAIAAACTRAKVVLLTSVACYLSTVIDGYHSREWAIFKHYLNKVFKEAYLHLYFHNLIITGQFVLNFLCHMLQKLPRAGYLRDGPHRSLLPRRVYVRRGRTSPRQQSVAHHHRIWPSLARCRHSTYAYCLMCEEVNMSMKISQFFANIGT